MSKSTLPLLVALTPSTKALLRERAQEEGRSMTAVVEDALRAYITDPTGHDLTVTPSAAGYERTVFYVEAKLIQPLRNYALIRGASLHRLVEGVIRAYLATRQTRKDTKMINPDRANSIIRSVFEELHIDYRHDNGQPALYVNDSGELCDWNTCVLMSDEEMEAEALETITRNWIRDVGAEPTEEDEE